VPGRSTSILAGVIDMEKSLESKLQMVMDAVRQAEQLLQLQDIDVSDVDRYVTRQFRKHMMTLGDCLRDRLKGGEK